MEHLITFPWMAPLLSGTAAACLILVMLRLRHALPMDQPNHRSLHDTPIPRSGGIAIMISTVLGWSLLALSGYGTPQLATVAAGAILLSVLSFFDDLRGLPVSIRFGAQIAAATVIILTLMPSVPLLGVVISVLAIVWMTNLFNFMDGANGLAGGMAAFGFGFYAIAALLGESPSLALTCTCITSAALGFLLFNLHPARIFMGDAGSIPLGFLAGTLGLLGWHEGLWPLMFPVLTFSPFIFDATITLARRVVRGEKVWQAHRSHYYQRLIRMGNSHRKTAMWEYALMLLSGIAALWSRNLSETAQMMLMLFAGAAYGIIAAYIDATWRRFEVTS